MWTVQLTLVAGLGLGAAWVAHGLGRVPVRRARVRRLLVHPATPAAVVVLLGAGIVLLAVASGSESLPRRYADYVPDDGAGVRLDPALVAASAGMLIGTATTLVALWAWLRFGRPAGGRPSRLRHLLPGVGVALVLVGLAVSWGADRTGPAEVGWYLYPPLSDSPGPMLLLDGHARMLAGIAGALAALGVAVLAMTAGFRAGRSETGAADAP